MHPSQTGALTSQHSSQFKNALQLEVIDESAHKSHHSVNDSSRGRAQFTVQRRTTRTRLKSNQIEEHK